MSKVLIIGSGGREHALGWKLAQSAQVTEVLYAPGNGGTAEGKGRNLKLNATQAENWPALIELIQSEPIALTVVGPEAPLSAGLVDTLQKHGITSVFGPSQAASQLESDKFFSYRILEKLGIPQAHSALCQSTQEARQAIDAMTGESGIVLKACGLASGKGVVVCDTPEEAFSALETLTHKYGEQILVAERLYGPEFSIFGIADGECVRPIEIALQDHKRLLDEDKGPNTGGMGAYGPAPIAPTKVIQEIADTVMTPVIQELKAQGTPYCGFLYAGMMMTQSGPKVIEFNVRFGDPECQPAMTMLDCDLFVLLQQALAGKLKECEFRFKPGASCCVVLASQGYPGSSQQGLKISGLTEANAVEGVKVFHAGTTQKDGAWYTAGGRVLGVNAYASSGLLEAQQRAYQAVQCLSVEGNFHFRTDIAAKALREIV